MLVGPSAHPSQARAHLGNPERNLRRAPARTRTSLRHGCTDESVPRWLTPCTKTRSHDATARRRDSPDPLPISRGDYRGAVVVSAPARTTPLDPGAKRIRPKTWHPSRRSQTRFRSPTKSHPHRDTKTRPPAHGFSLSRTIPSAGPDGEHRKSREVSRINTGGPISQNPEYPLANPGSGRLVRAVVCDGQPNPAARL